MDVMSKIYSFDFYTNVQFTEHLPIYNHLSLKTLNPFLIPTASVERKYAYLISSKKDKPVASIEFMYASLISTEKDK